MQAATTAEAIRELNALITARDKKKLKIAQHATKLSKAIEDYKASEVFTKKRLATQQNETTYFKAWEERLGNTCVDEITKAKIVAVRDDLVADRKVGGSEESVSHRIANLYVLALKQVLKFCEERGKLAELPSVSVPEVTLTPPVWESAPFRVWAAPALVRAPAPLMVPA